MKRQKHYKKEGNLTHGKPFSKQYSNNVASKGTVAWDCLLQLNVIKDKKGEKLLKVYCVVRVREKNGEGYI